ncbi:MAG TPA: SseB family protein [Puia sp.]|uniref:SseB family protein n=1 Tax=Puia sp. TaxID=2045100 RepID=UPI002C15A61A|nr:SseB family protein [Puia sp.]HVU96891.1 SseB family protein [Puia sp.]
MKMFQRIFGKGEMANRPDNTRLLQLLDVYWMTDGKGNTYKNVVLELMNGNSFLLLPGPNEVCKQSDDWITTQEAMTLKLSSLYTHDGLKVLAAFTDEKALLEWSKKPCPYASMRSQDLLELCEANGIKRIVINNNSSNTFVLERGGKYTEEYEVPANSEVQIGLPNTPLNRLLLEKLIARFGNLDNIKRVYHYGQTNGKEVSLILGFELTRRSDNGKKAVVGLVRDTIGNEELPHPLDIFFIETEECRRQIRAIGGSLIYEIG